MKNLTLKSKLIASFLFAGLTPLLITSIYFYTKSTDTLNDEALSRLNTVKSLKAGEIKRTFQSIRDQVISFSHDVMIKSAMKEFTETFNNYSQNNPLTSEEKNVQKEEVKNFYLNEFLPKYREETGKDIDIDKLLANLDPNALALQYQYIGNNPNPLGSKDALNFSEDNSEYSKIHSKYHSSIRDFLQKFDYYDIFLVDINSGNIVYSVFKEADYATSLSTGTFSNTNFADVFNKAKELTSPDEFAIVDYEKYQPSYDSPASFIASAIWSNGKKIGVLVFQMPIDRVNTVMNDHSGMGKTGEAYLVGKNKLMRSDSYLDPKNFSVASSYKNAEKLKLNTKPVEEALKGISGNMNTLNYLNQKVISSFSPIDILGMKWGIIAEISEEEALHASTEIKNLTIIIISISSLLIFIFSYILSTNLTKTIQKIASKLLESANQVEDSSSAISISSNKLSEASDESSSSLQETVSAIDEISSMVQRNADAANGSTKVSEKSSEAAKKGKSTVVTMIKSIEDISTGNQEIAAEMERNNEDISRIVQVISEIGEKTKVINDIVFQTKLLSFNASVEAARAGEHGKGFSVVAEEVGNLASMSGKAALEITELLDSSTQQVTDIVEKTKKNVTILVENSKNKVEIGKRTANECDEVLEEILQNVTSVNDLVKEVSSASSEQSIGVNEVTSAMQQLDQITHKNTMSAKESSTMANKLNTQAVDLNTAVKELMALVSGNREEPLKLKKKIKSPASKKPVAPKKSIISKEVAKPKEVAVTIKEKEVSPKESSSKKESLMLNGIPHESDDRFEDL